MAVVNGRAVSRRAGYLVQSYRSHEGQGGCHTQDEEMAGRLVADRIGLVVAGLAKAPFVDPDRVVVMGHSADALRVT